MWPTVQQHYTGSTSTPPRVARLCQIREASLLALKKFHNIYGCPHVPIVRLVPFTVRSACNSSCHSFPSCQLPGELVSLSLVTIQASISVCRIVHVPVLSSRCRSDSRQSWPMKSSAVSKIPNLEWTRISCECVSYCDSLLVSLPLRVLCYCLLSRVSGMIVQSLSG